MAQPCERQRSLAANLSAGLASLPRWSPDATQIAYVDIQPGRPWKTFLISAQGGSPQEMLADSHNPGGRDLVCRRQEDCLRAKRGCELRSLYHRHGHTSGHTVPGSEGLFSPRWSPDG